LRYNQKLRKLSIDALFDSLDSDGNGELDEGEFKTFFENADMEVKLLEMELTPDEIAKARECLDGHVKAEVKDELEVEKKEDGDDSKDVKEEPMEDAPKPGEEPVILVPIHKESAVEKVKLSKDELSRLFTYLLEEGERRISKETFLRLTHLYMKVVKDAVVMTLDRTISSSSSGTLKRLEQNEVVEVIDGPLRDPSIGILRIFCKALSDGTDGWVSVTGNQGSNYLVEGGNLFKVVKETILTDSFELDGEKASIKLKETTRKLKEGTTLEVHIWPRKEESSGLMRMKGKVRNDGAIGWVTAIGNTGAVFLEPV